MFQACDFHIIAPYCTVRLRLMLRLTPSEVAVITRLYVPAGVPGLLVLVFWLPPPHALNDIKAAISPKQKTYFGRRGRNPGMHNRTVKPKASHKNSSTGGRAPTKTWSS